MSWNSMNISKLMISSLLFWNCKWQFSEKMLFQNNPILKSYGSVPDGELFYKIVEVGNYSESDAQGIVRQIVQGICYLHKVGIAHR